MYFPANSKDKVQGPQKGGAKGKPGSSGELCACSLVLGPGDRESSQVESRESLQGGVPWMIRRAAQ